MSIRASICQILGEDSPSSLYWKRSLQKDTCGPGGDWQRFRRLPDQIVWPEEWTKIGKAARNREKQTWVQEKPMLDNARRLRRIYWIDPDDSEHSDILKNARRKLERLVAPCHAKGWFILASRKWCRAMGKKKELRTMYGCIVESHESTRQRVQSKNSWRTHCRKRIYFDDTLQYGAQVYSDATDNEKSGCQSCRGQGKEKASDSPSLRMHSAGMQTECINHWKFLNFLNRIFLLEQQKLPVWQKPLAQTAAMIIQHEKTSSKMFWTILNWQTRKWSNFTKYRTLVWMIINSNKRNWNQLENCQKFARKLSWNACTWHELDEKRQKYHWRYCEYGTLVSKSSFREPDQCLCGRHGLVL